MNYIVVKCGGSVLEKLPDTFYKNLVNLQQSGQWQPVIVHGGGPLINSLLGKLGVETMFVEGMRVTTPEVLQVVEMVLSGSVNKQIVSNIQKAGGNAFGLSGVDGGFIEAKSMDSTGKLGLVGEVVDVKIEYIDHLLEQGLIPVISPLGVDEHGQKYNINGDVAASAVAQALGAKLCFISDIPGVFVEKNGVKTTLNELSKAEAEQLIDDNIITGGMIPKVRAAIDGLTHNVKQAVILNGMEEDSLIHYINGKKIGTKMTASEGIHYV